ncbi:MAG: hypothetical protein K6T83_15450 [Alicyclobacillus sp.]|nr:hypothetical protein [Alicyclobacillus sp.]
MQDNDLEAFVEDLIQDSLLGLIDDLAQSIDGVSHHTGLEASEHGYTTHLVLNDVKETIVIPGFDMKWDKRPVGPNGEMRGGLLTGPVAEQNAMESGKRYNVIPIPTEKLTGYHKLVDPEEELYISANMLASVRGVEAAIAFLQGAGASPDEIYEWKTGRYHRAIETPSGPVVFRTVSEDSPAASWWHPPMNIEIPVRETDEVLRDIDSLFEGGV